MPVKRRHAKRRIDVRAELEAWSGVFDCGCDFFQDLPPIGVVTDAYDRVERSVALDAWLRLGALFLTDRKPNPHRQPWALEQFGDPRCL